MLRIFMLVFIMCCSAVVDAEPKQFRLRGELNAGYAIPIAVGFEYSPLPWLALDAHAGFDVNDIYEGGVLTGVKHHPEIGLFVGTGLGLSYINVFGYKSGCLFTVGTCTSRSGTDGLMLDVKGWAGFELDIGLFVRLNLGVRRELASSRCMQGTHASDAYDRNLDERCKPVFFPHIGIAAGWAF